MRVLISGAGGLIGTRLQLQLRESGHTISRLVRRPVHNVESEVFWSPRRGELDLEALERFAPDVVIHLAGHSIAGLWTATHKRKIRESRRLGTTLLANSIASLKKPPSCFISVSAIGIYGNRGDEPLTEASPPGEGFLAEVCQLWESSADPARAAGIRTVHPRVGVVLAREGGMFNLLRPLYALGLGSRLGSGEQGMSWVHIDDLVRAILFIAETETIEGAVNLTAPEPVSQGEFSRSFASALGRPHWLRAPAWVLKLMPGGMGREMLLASQWVRPQVLLKHGFDFKFVTVKPAIENLLDHE